jgi:hypothetical protein
MRSKWLGGRGFCLGGGGLRDAGRWQSQAAVAKVRVALVYATCFHCKLRALSGLVALGSGEPQARATPSQKGLRWCRSAALVFNMSWVVQRNAVPMDRQSRNMGAHPIGMGMRQWHVLMVSPCHPGGGGSDRCGNGRPCCRRGRTRMHDGGLKLGADGIVGATPLVCQTFRGGGGHVHPGPSPRTPQCIRQSDCALRRVPSTGGGGGEPTDAWHRS